jgi:2-polyprenyl-3-methyl-5-hydroxy-6-metoxy-1,4-benzoquinol methylase
LEIRDQTGYKTLEIISKADNFNKWTYDTIRPFLKGRILEIGSGLGNISKYVIADYTDVTLSDFDNGYYENLKKVYSFNPHVSEILQINVQQNNFNLYYASLKESFDSIFILNVVEHLKDDSAALKNCKFLLKPGGFLIVLVPAYSFLYSNMDKELGHYRRYTSKSLSALMQQQGLKLIQNRYFNILGIAGWFFSSVFLKSKLIKQSEMTLFDKLVPFAKFIDKLFHKSFGLSVITIAKK